MKLGLAAASASLALVLAGCVSPGAADLETAAAALPLALPSLAPEDMLFADPENTPHPAFGWPTLIAPARGTAVPEAWSPIPALPLPETIAGLEHVTATDGVANGAGISLFGGLAVVPGFGDKSWILDISEPTAPKVLSEFEPVQGHHRGSAVIAYPDGKLAAVFSTSGGFEVWDITDPANPVAASQVEPTQKGHKLGVVPGTPYVYNAASKGGGSLPQSLFADQATGVTEIYDLTDPTMPRHVQDFRNGFSCHHIFFWNTAEKQRAICAGVHYAQIWDTADPENPVVLTNVPIPHGDGRLPSTNLRTATTPFAHFAILNAAGDILVVGDEFGGGSRPPGCTVGGKAPTGALWFYDVSDESKPELLGWWSARHHLEPAQAQTSCTAHHGRLVPDPEGRDVLAIAFYGAGVVLLDFSDPKNVKLLDQWKDMSDTWEVWYYNGYLFTGDLARGVDVLKFK